MTIVDQRIPRRFRGPLLAHRRCALRHGRSPFVKLTVGFSRVAERSGATSAATHCWASIIHSHTELGFDHLFQPKSRHTHLEFHPQRFPKTPIFPCS